MQLDIELGKHVGVEDACFRYVPDSSGFYNVPNDKLLDGLILGHAPGAVRAANGLHMAAALFGATVVSSFFGHQEVFNPVTVTGQHHPLLLLSTPANPFAWAA